MTDQRAKKGLNDMIKRLDDIIKVIRANNLS